MARAKWFLFGGYLTDPERDLLQQLATGADLPAEQGPTERAHRIHALLEKGVIAENAPAAVDAAFSTLQEAFSITPKGHQYLEMTATTPASDESTK